MSPARPHEGAAPATRRPDVSEHHHEPEPGLPEALPANERLLWQGRPDWRVLARRGFHFNKFALYFLVLIGWRLVATLADGGTIGMALASTLWTVPLAMVALGFIAGLAWLVGRTTIYTLTDRRLVLRVGVVLNVTFNLPLRCIETDRLQQHAGGAGDISVLLTPENRIGYLHLWPHVRPWHFTRTEPTLRALPQALGVASLLADALARSTEGVATAAAGARPGCEPAGVPTADLRDRPAHAAQASHGREPLANAA